MNILLGIIIWYGPFRQCGPRARSRDYPLTPDGRIVPSPSGGRSNNIFVRVYDLKEKNFEKKNKRKTLYYAVYRAAGRVICTSGGPTSCRIKCCRARREECDTAREKSVAYEISGISDRVLKIKRFVTSAWSAAGPMARRGLKIHVQKRIRP